VCWNSLAWALGMNSDLFVLQNQVVNNNTATVTVTLEDSGYLYVYADKSGPSEAKISYNGFSTTSYDYLNRSYLMAAGRADAGTVVTITNADSDKSGQGLNLNTYVIDEDVLADMYKVLNQEPLKISRYDSTSISGTVTSRSGGTMFTSIPYDKGWAVYVDGILTQTDAYEDAFLSFPVAAGSHTVEMKYTPEGFQIGLLISLISLILLVMICLLIRQWHASRRQMALNHHQKDETDSEKAAEPNKTVRKANTAQSQTKKAASASPVGSKSTKTSVRKTNSAESVPLSAFLQNTKAEQTNSTIPEEVIDLAKKDSAQSESDNKTGGL